MASRLGDEFDALIISTGRWGFFVELEEMFVEGLVPIETLPGDRYGFHENTRRVVASAPGGSSRSVIACTSSCPYPSAWSVSCSLPW